MIQFSKHQLANGLRVLIHEDKSTPMVAVNLLYNVGARDESPDKTGFAHLFEHLMFSGSENVKDFDEPIQRAGGDSNAFTNNDVTNFYDLVPAENVETVLWLESDRMLSLNINERDLDIQRKVVVEEFKETCLNEPYGDVWHHLADLAYTQHPYRWPTIGKVPAHVEEATLDDVRDFYQKHYCPNNAILVIAGNIKEKQILNLVNKWFGDIPARPVPERHLPAEPPQVILQRRVQQAKVPVNALYLAFHVPERSHRDFYVVDLISDILGNGPSSRLFRKLHKQAPVFNSIDAYVTGSIDPGLLIIEGQPVDGVSLEEAEKAVWKELKLLCDEPISKRELQKYKNKIESTLVFSESNVLNKAINLAFFELLGDANLINEEAKFYQEITEADIQRVTQKIFIEENCSALFYTVTKEEQ